jgi:hypothetical protein
MGDCNNTHNTGDANGEIVGQVKDEFDEPYSVARYETTSGPWHNILDVPGTETWPGQAVCVTTEDYSPSGSAVAIQGSNEDLAQTENATDAKKKKKRQNGGKSDKKKDGNGPSKTKKQEG